MGTKQLLVTARRITMPDGSVHIVEDAPLGAWIAVRQKHIDRGVANDPRHCVIAEAAHDSLGTKTVVIWKTRALFEAPNGRVYRYFLAEATQRFVARVDAGLPVQPARLRLLAPVGRGRIGAGDHGDGGHPDKREGSGTNDGDRRVRVWRGPRGNFSLRGSAVTIELT